MKYTFKVYVEVPEEYTGDEVCQLLEDVITAGQTELCSDPTDTQYELVCNTSFEVYHS